MRRLRREHLRALACLMITASSMALATLVISFRVHQFVNAATELVANRDPNVLTELVRYECSNVDYIHTHILYKTNGDRMLVMLISNFHLGGANHNNRECN